MGRPRTNQGPGLLLGGAGGAAVGGPVGALVGAFLGATVTTQPLSLDAALRQACGHAGVQLAYWRRESKVELLVAFRDQLGRYWTAHAPVAPVAGMTPDALDDALFDSFQAALARWRAQHGPAQAS